MAKVLLVEDDKDLANVVLRWLTKEGHICEHAAAGLDAEQLLKVSSFDLIILDWSLPDLEGIEILRRHRQAGGVTSVIMLTGRSAMTDKLEGFDRGADDYLTKPFHAKELMARVRALLSRPQNLQDKHLVTGILELMPEIHAVRRGEEKIQLVPREFNLLKYLMTHPNQLISSDRLLDLLWPGDDSSTPEALMTCVSRLRKKIERPNEPALIRNVHGVGYGLFTDPGL
ncbi:MAG: response regulator transcription factor [Cyanobacteria bacterium SZAS TMP-1]|nr:response regulator transcription factor [Cyanobacteria bacterium SZAS TMP-1]